MHMRRPSNRRIILASGSPRRLELLAGLDLDFTVDTLNNFEEIVLPGTPAVEVPLQMAKGKSEGFHRPLEDDEILITADTVVIVSEDDGGEKVLGKPHSRDEAFEMLRLLSGRSHRVLTAVVIRDKSKTISFTDSTLVHFENIGEEEAAYYIDKYRPFDKAGGYGIQEWIGYATISGISGSYFNVMGFPVHRVYQALKEFI